MSLMLGALLRGLTGVVMVVSTLVAFVIDCVVSTAASSSLTFFGRPLLRGGEISDSPFSAAVVNGEL